MPPTRSRTVLVWGLAAAVLVMLASIVGGMTVRSLYHGAGSGRPAPPVDPLLPPDQQPGSNIVQFTPGAAQHPDREVVRALLQAHFDSINVGRYDVWKTTVVSARVRDMPEYTWKRSYRSTRDGSILVHRIDPGRNDSFRVMLSFTSTQDPVDAPKNIAEPCLRWRAMYSLVDDGSGLKLDTGLPGSTLASPCRK